ncbi:MAG: malto-oligosyltrehalose trehalohydrolase, partial [Candidatus Competibacterales bacterium]
PAPWAEWNGKYRDAVRDYWRGEGGVIGELAARLAGSEDLYGHNGRAPTHSINFVTAHDGFTLRDLVSYNSKHNEANGEDNRDGDDHNRSWNCGVEGETDEPGVLALRSRQQRNLLATLLLSQGVPMLLYGDERHRSQRGNNNAYNQDSPLSWFDWSQDPEALALTDYVKALLALRRAHPALRRGGFFKGQHPSRPQHRDVFWYRPDGEPMDPAAWGDGLARCLATLWAGDGLSDRDQSGELVVDDDWLMLFNAHGEPVAFTLPDPRRRSAWELVLDTNTGFAATPILAEGHYTLQGHALALLAQRRRVAEVADAAPLRRHHPLPFGAEFVDGRVRFRLWAPGATTVAVALESEDVALTRDGRGWFEGHVKGLTAGTQYAFLIDGEVLVPDPASRYNPVDVHGVSQLIDPRAFDWRDGDWHGRPWEEAVIYELHVGTFSPRGTFSGVKERLDYLVSLGVTAIELMPVADFPGGRNWGYDGVLWFAPDSRYGHPDELKDLVQAAHQKGLMVLLDVVYNHFGPEGNYLHRYAEAFFNHDRPTPWGAAIDLDGDHSAPVRDFIVHNALYWLEEFHLDGLRLDAVHAIADRSDQHLLEALAQAVRQGPGRHRHIHLILENDANQAPWLERSEGRATRYTAQWNDDFHHVFHYALTGETDGYYRDYAQNVSQLLPRCLSEGFAYQGEASPFRDGQKRGTPSSHFAPQAFVSFLQNHDQVGNRALGERLHQLCPAPALEAAVALWLLTPQIPLLWMGEEFAAPSPFPFFCDFGPELAEAVTAGRRKEFARFEAFSSQRAQRRIPDPNDPATFESAKLDWRVLSQESHQSRRRYYQTLLALRHQWVVPRLAATVDLETQVLGDRALRLVCTYGDGQLIALSHLGTRPVEAVAPAGGQLLFASHPRAAAEVAKGHLVPQATLWYALGDLAAQAPAEAVMASNVAGGVS